MNSDEIDLVARKEYAALLRHYGASLITNRQFEQRVPDREERGLDEIHFGLLQYYDARSEQTFASQFGRSAKRREEIARVILFLRSDMAYRWPHVGGFQSLLSLLTFGWFGRFWWRRKAPAGDMTVWPFYTRGEYENALQNPPYLCGETKVSRGEPQ